MDDPKLKRITSLGTRPFSGLTNAKNNFQFSDLDFSVYENISKYAIVHPKVFHVTWKHVTAILFPCTKFGFRESTFSLKSSINEINVYFFGSLPSNKISLNTTVKDSGQSSPPAFHISKTTPDGTLVSLFFILFIRHRIFSASIPRTALFIWLPR